MAEASNWISEVRWDEQGRPYRVYLLDGPGYRAGQRTYISPAEPHPSNTSDPRLLQWAAQNQAPQGGFLRGRGVWDSREGEWDQPINAGNLISVGLGAAMGAPFLAGALGGGGGGAAASGATGATGAASGALPASSIPVSASMYGPAAIASQGVSAGIPLGGVGAAGSIADVLGGNKAIDQAMNTAGGGSTLGKLAGWLKDNGGDLAALGLPAAAMAFGGGGGGGASLPPEISRLLQMSEARTRRADPLHQAAVQMAFGALPTYGRQGINLPKVDLP